MTVKSIIDIDVDDSKFKRFQELFDKYNAQLAKTPNAWKKVGGETATVATQFERMTAAMMAQAHQARETSEDDKKRLNTLTLSERLWTSMAKSTGTFAKNILHAGESLLRWTGLLGAVSGLLGVGGLFGIDRMAARASGERRSATGLGMSIGQEKSFGINLGRFVNPGTFLSGINQAVSNIANQGPLWALGVNPNQSTEQVALATLKAVRAKALATPVNQLGLLGNMYHLDELGIGNEDIRRLRSASPGEFNAQIAGYGKDAASLNITDKTAKAWQDFTSQMQRAGESIFKVFVQGLEPLAPSLEHLSASFIKFLETLSQSPLIEHAITSLAGWLENFSGKVGSSAFLDAVERFVSDVGGLADAIHAVVHPLDTYNKVVGGGVGGAAYNFMHPEAEILAGNKSAYLKMLAGLDVDRAFPEGLLERQFMTESGGNLHPINSSKGAIGPFQFMPDTAKQYGIDPRDPMQSARGAAEYDAFLMRKYHNDMQKSLAAYNYGPANLDAVLSKHPNDWMKYVPKETRDYVAKTVGLNVNIINQTGGNATTAISALAPP